MYQKTTWYNTNEFKKQTQCPITGEIYAICPVSFRTSRQKKCMGRHTCGFRACAESQEERLEQIHKHLSGKDYCSIQYLRDENHHRPTPIYTDWIKQHYQPTNKFQSPINMGMLKPEWIQADPRLQKALSNKTEIQIPDRVQEVVANLIWKRTGEKPGYSSRNWKEAGKVIQKFWFWRRNTQLEQELKKCGPVWTKIDLMVTYVMRDINPDYQQQKRQGMMNSRLFYQQQLKRIQQEM